MEVTMAPIEIKSTPEQMVRQIYQLDIKNPECAGAAFGLTVGCLLGHPGDGCILGFIAGCLCKHSYTSIKIYERDVQVQNIEAQNIEAKKISRE